MATYIGPDGKAYPSYEDYLKTIGVSAPATQTKLTIGEQPAPSLVLGPTGQPIAKTGYEWVGGELVPRTGFVAPKPDTEIAEETKEATIIGPGLDEVEEDVTEFEKDTDTSAIKTELEGLQTLLETYQTELAEKLKEKVEVKEEIPEEIIEEEEETPEETETKQITSDIEDIDTAIDDAESKAMAVKATISDASSYEELSAIISIRDDYERRRVAVREMGDRQKKALETFNIRRGTQRYAVETAEGIITETERLILRELNALKTEENRLVNAMKQSIRTENYDAYMDFKDELEEKREKKVDRLQDLNDTIRIKNDEIEEKNKIARRDFDILGAIRDLETRDPMDLFDHFGGKYTLEEIDDALADTEVDIAKEEIKTFDGIPHRAIKDENGNTIRYEPIPGVEKEEDIKWSGGKPYRAVKDAEGNIVRYEQLPGIVDEEAEAKPISASEVKRLDEMYPDAGIVYGDTAKSAEDKISFGGLMNQGFSIEQARDIRESDVAPNWFRVALEAQEGKTFPTDTLDALWNQSREDWMATTETTGTPETSQSALETLKEGV